MRKIFLLLALALVSLSTQAIPADPTPMRVMQPDGSTITVQLHGDEFFHFTTTTDGYTVVKNQAGYYTYARLDGDRLVAGDRIARDVAQRTAADRAALAAIPKGLASPGQAQSGSRRLAQRNSAMHRVGAEGQMDYDAFRGLIILVNYTDKKFSMTGANAFYDDMVNTHDYTGYTLNNRRVNMTGSVRDYFYDNSNHIFDPHFDVVGPVDVPYSCRYPNGSDNSDAIFYAALDSIDGQVDFNDYDTDGDGYVDMVFFLVAGFSANYSGNNQGYLWPHMYYLYWAPPHDGVNFGLYACSTEIAGWEGYYSDVNGIGTFCHEFGHVLGLPDLYDTDYSGGGGESRHPGEWSIMAGGSGNNFGRDPVGYSLYERYALGFTTPALIEQGGEYQLEALDKSNQGLRLNTANQDEYFLIENRQAGKWDRSLPGHGMLVARVDSSDTRVWWQNTVNCNPSHMYYELLRARYTGEASDSDPFPGRANVTSITNFTNPSLMTWDKTFSDLVMFDITEQDGIVRFTMDADSSILNIVEDFERMPVTDNESAKGVRGVYCKWNFSKSAVASPGEGKCHGEHAVAMKKPSQIATAQPLNIIPYAVHYTVFNPTTSSANFRVTYSVDSGKTWNDAENNVLTVDAGETRSATVNLPSDQPIMFRINQTAGSGRVNCYLDDIKLYYKDKWGPDVIEGDVNGDGEVNISDVNALIDMLLTGQADASGDVNGDGEVNIADVNAVIDIILQAR